MPQSHAAWRATYTPGSWVVLAGPSSLVVLQPAPAKMSTLLNSIWDAVVDSASAEQLVAALASFGLDRMRNLAAFFWDEQGMHSLVRGSITVVDPLSGDVVNTGEGVVTWSERGVPNRLVRIDMEPVDEESVLQLPLMVGAVSASAIVLDATATTAPSFPAAGAEAAAPQRSVAAEPVVPGPPVALPPDSPAPDLQLVPEPARPVIDEPDLALEPVALGEQVAVEAETDDNALERPLVGDEAPQDSEPEVQLEDAPSPDQEAFGAEDRSFGQTQGVDPGLSIFGAPVPEPVAQHAAVQPEPSPAVQPSPPAPAPLPSPPVVPAAAMAPGVPAAPVPNWQQPPAQAAGAPFGGQPQPYGQPPAQQPYQQQPQQQPWNGGQQPGLGEQQPQPGWHPQQPAQAPQVQQPPAQSWNGQPAQQPHNQFQGAPEQYGQAGQQPPAQQPPVHNQWAPQQPVALEDQHDGETVFVTGIAATHKPGAAQRGADDGLILASMCAAGHPNPPGSLHCRFCPAPVNSNNPQLVNRPSLATLRVSSGEALDVLGPILVGRAPSAPANEPAATTLKVSSPSSDISRTHLRIAPDGWNVLATDLHSTNGTLVHRAGEGPIRLNPGEGVSISVGDVLDLGDGVTIEVAPPA